VTTVCLRYLEPSPSVGEAAFDPGDALMGERDEPALKLRTTFTGLQKIE
jgi:hypothetical protein